MFRGRLGVVIVCAWTAGCGSAEFGARAGGEGEEDHVDCAADPSAVGCEDRPAPCEPNECGTCGICEHDCAGPGEGCRDWAEEERTTGVGETEEGWLVLDGRAVTRHVIWPSSSGWGDVYRVNSQTLQIEAAFWTGPSGASESPSRSGVDDQGNLVISNRSGLDGIGSITKIAGNPATCPDRDGDGVVRTSTAWNDKLAFRSRVDWDDDCILWHTPVGAAGATPRAVILHREAMALDGGEPREMGWVGLYGESRFLQFDAETGGLTGVEAPTPGCSPYGGAIDREGVIWLSGCGGSWTDIGRFDTADPAGSFSTVALPSGAGYRVIVDETDTPWIAGSDAFRYDRATATFRSVGLPEPPGNIASDGEGSVWAASYTVSPHVFRISNDDALAVRTIETPGTATFGMAVDFDHHAWTFGYTDGTASVIDIDTEQVTHVFDDCGGAPCLSYPYVRGDITGLQRRNAMSPRGGWDRLFEGCEARTDWQAVAIDADAPAGTSVTVSARTGATIEETRAAPWVVVATVPPDGPDLDLDAAFAAAGVDDAAFLELEVALESLDHETSPTVRSVSVRRSCAESFQ